jgi:hypothetical protein
VPTKIVLRVGFLERDFDSDHLAEKSYWTIMGQKYTVRPASFEAGAKMCGGRKWGPTTTSGLHYMGVTMGHK